jgi:hypothetical protein
MQPPDDEETKKKTAVRRTWAMMERIYGPFMDLFFKTLTEGDATIAALFKGQIRNICYF